MSVVAQSPFSGTKRRGIHDDVEPHSFDRSIGPGTKRARYLASPAGRCSLFSSENSSHAVNTNNFLALRALFPDMDDQVVAHVLTECGDNIEAAIRRLGELRLATQNDEHQQEGQLQQEQQHRGHDTPPQTPQYAHQTPPHVSGTTTPGTCSPKTQEEWVDFLVKEMASSASIDDARQRAAHVLQAFSQFIATLTQQQNSRTDDMAALQGKLEEVLRDNHILKRAVQVQHSRIQERSALESELQQLKNMVVQYQEQVRTLELNNYSLALHLQKATNGASLSDYRPPDVY